MPAIYHGYGCGDIFNTLNIAADGLHHCCYSLNREWTMPGHHETFPLDLYLTQMHRLVADNEKRQGPCQGCFKLASGTYPREFSGFKFVVLNHFAECNAKCYYCSRPGLKLPTNYMRNPLPLLRELITRGLLAPEAVFNFSGGEPSVHKYLADILDFFLGNGHNCSFCSNALIFSPAISEFMRHKATSIIISLDSGTPESFRSVKGVDGFEQVSENVLKYAERSTVILKYIVTPRATTEADIEGFINLASQVGAIIHISPELGQYNAPDNSDYRRLLFSFASRLYSAAYVRNLPATFSNFHPEDAARIRVAVLETMTLPDITNRVFSGSVRITEEELELFEKKVLAEIARLPAAPEPYRVLVELYNRQRRWPEAVSILSEAVSGHRDATGGLEASLGQAWAHLQKYDEAEAAYQKALTKNPDQLGWLYNLGYIRLKRGDHSGTREALRSIEAAERRTGAKFQKTELLLELAEKIRGRL